MWNLSLTRLQTGLLNYGKHNLYLITHDNKRRSERIYEDVDMYEINNGGSLKHIHSYSSRRYNSGEWYRYCRNIKKEIKSNPSPLNFSVFFLIRRAH